MHTVQPASSRSPRDSILRQSSGQELPGRGDAVLPGGDSGDRSVGRGVFVPHIDIKSPRAQILHLTEVVRVAL
jgi:hypothetical protein